MATLERDIFKRTASAYELAKQLQAVLLNIAKEPNDYDLRSLMQKLWPEGSAAIGVNKRVTLELPNIKNSSLVANENTPSTEIAKPKTNNDKISKTYLKQQSAILPIRRKVLVVISMTIAVLAAISIFLAWNYFPQNSQEVHKLYFGIATDNQPIKIQSVETSAGAPVNYMPPVQTSVIPASAIKPATSLGANRKVITNKESVINNKKVPKKNKLKDNQNKETPLNKNSAVLEIISTSTWANITINGKTYGTTPLIIELPAGKYKLQAQRDGWQAVAYTITLTAGETRRWSPQMHMNAP
ncbi:MAG: PEGA domain-containing protein [Deltaproteobacteria bacterium]|nr:PEGA domain-containing protein [Deltaproteobacteria bacterium]